LPSRASGARPDKAKRGKKCRRQAYRRRRSKFFCKKAGFRRAALRACKPAQLFLPIFAEINCLNNLIFTLFKQQNDLSSHGIHHLHPTSVASVGYAVSEQ
jgi:hypothetical protein